MQKEYPLLRRAHRRGTIPVAAEMWRLIMFISTVTGTSRRAVPELAIRLAGEISAAGAVSG